MEGLASRNYDQPGWKISDHQHAGADAPWLAAGRRKAHAHVWLFGTRTLAELDLGRGIPRHLGIRATHSLAVRWQGWSDGAPAENSRACRNTRNGGSRPSAPTGEHAWLGWHGPNTRLRHRIRRGRNSHPVIAALRRLTVADCPRGGRGTNVCAIDSEPTPRAALV